MDGLIRMQDAIEAICDEIMSRFDVGVTEGYELVEDALSGLPSVEPRKKGKWILTQDENYEYCTCSECGYQNGENWMIGANIPFCAMCGSYNGGEQDEIN